MCTRLVAYNTDVRTNLKRMFRVRCGMVRETVRAENPQAAMLLAFQVTHANLRTQPNVTAVELDEMIEVCELITAPKFERAPQWVRKQIADGLLPAE